MKFVLLSLLAVCALHAVLTTGQQTFDCPGLDVPDGCGTYVNCNNGQVEKDCSDSTPDCDQGADFCLQHCISCSGAGDDEDEVAVLSANDCLPAEGRGDPPPNDRRLPAWQGSWDDRTASHTGIGRMTRIQSTDDTSRRCAHCTGFAIEDDFILTAAHCVENSDTPVKTIALGRVGDKKKTYVADVDKEKCRWPSSYHGDNDWEFDYAVCKIPKASSKKVRDAVTKFDISTPVDTQTEASFDGVNIAGYPIANYPQEQAAQGRYKLPFQLGPAYPCSVDVKPTSQDNRKTLEGTSTDCTVSPGQSGSPIFNNDTLRVYGILAKNDRDFKPFGPALTQSVIDNLLNYMDDLNT